MTTSALVIAPDPPALRRPSRLAGAGGALAESHRQGRPGAVESES